jgi:hypothetical protein
MVSGPVVVIWVVANREAYTSLAIFVTAHHTADLKVAIGYIKQAYVMHIQLHKTRNPI